MTPLPHLILIPTTPDRQQLLDRLQKQLLDLIYRDAIDRVYVEINEDNREKTTGQKRNELIQRAIDLNCGSISFVDSDDLVGDTYIQRAHEFMGSGMDCGELWGDIYWNGKKGKPFHHSIEHKEWWEDDKFYYRCPNHLNFMRLDKVKDFKFPDQNFGEDGQWSMAIKEAGVLKTQYAIPEVIYHYYNGLPKHEIV